MLRKKGWPLGPSLSVLSKTAESSPTLLNFALCLWFCLSIFYLLLFLCRLPPSQHFVKWLLGECLLSPPFTPVFWKKGVAEM